jgi:sugar phosphate isomerase/epimerase
MHNEIGVIAPLRPGGETLKKAADFGLKVCQVVSWKPEDWKGDATAALRGEMAWLDVRITGFWTGWPGPRVWDFIEGPTTLGLVPAKHRPTRIGALMRGADFAKSLGIKAIITHLGFIPENPADPLFAEVVEAVREVAEHCAEQGVEFWFETGQETPVTMLRLIKEVGTGNLGINLDPANLVMYGKANPVDALEVFGDYVRNVHAKDGMYPTDPMKLGPEVRLGEGRVRWPEFVKRLGEIGFDGEFIIEREIKEGAEQKKDIAAAVEYLRELLEKA